MTTTSPRLVTWENGTDLVIELPLDVEPAAVWAKLTDREEAGTWFAPFRVESPDGEPDEDSETESDTDPTEDTDSAGDANPRITFDLGEAQLEGVILSSEVEDHVLVELDDFGVLGFQLLPLELTDGAATLLVFTQSAPDVESARLKAADFGPMWDTHLRLFARSFGLEVTEASEPELLERYADLELEDGRDAE
ncbi:MULTISPECIES: hypothetical protein [unclassified Brevibacterium]|uniref:hypothetical protein n=1 Tax=unclassified Brevibacterium TaxID=2614124 RepID=UPI001E2CAF11|nr:MULTISPECIES: hypothetical protein [unclassified Brevibacterium]MCD1285651.1 hypothetical protein [Brevibacterium sp. CCUG 69071]MDK8434709.1 hypothetical protein [Brevibacterium sp. H-BE7]